MSGIYHAGCAKYSYKAINVEERKDKQRKENATKNTRASMVRIVDEDVIISFAVNDLATSTLNCRFVAQEYRKEVLHCDILSSIVLKHIKFP